MKSLTITLIAAGLFLTTQQSAEANTYVSDGERLYAKGDYIKALSCFESSVALDPKNAEGHYGLANVLLKLQKTQKAVSEYREAESLSPTGKIGEYSRKALAALSAQTGQNYDGDSGQSSPQSAQTAGSQAARSGNQRTQNGNAQTDDRKAAIIAEGNARAAEIKAEADRKIAALKQEMQSTLLNTDEYLSARGSRAGARVFNSGVQSDYNSQIEAIRSDAKRRADETIRTHQEKADLYN
jgi:tetratricopeptide (TPR) repeat protein